VYADNGSIQKWLRSWRALPSGQNNLKRTAHHTLQLDAETGVGLGILLGQNAYGVITEFANVSPAGPNYQLIAENGVEIVTESSLDPPGYDPQVMLRWSDDSGHTWSSEHWTSMGKIGEFGYRTFWRRLGSSRDRVYEVSGTDAVKIAIMGAELVLSPTSS
jgi:hypothetical protein